VVVVLVLAALVVVCAVDALESSHGIDFDYTFVAVCWLMYAVVIPAGGPYVARYNVSMVPSYLSCARPSLQP
ncbi:unnamed protein product, partial [Rhizoctonia solani]